MKLAYLSSPIVLALAYTANLSIKSSKTDSTHRLNTGLNNLLKIFIGGKSHCTGYLGNSVSLDDRIEFKLPLTEMVTHYEDYTLHILT